MHLYASRKAPATDRNRPWDVRPWPASVGFHRLEHMGAPSTRYVKSGGLHIAFQVVGEGPSDLVFVPGALSNIDTIWMQPASERFFRRLAAFSRLILYDKRGQGVSDPPPRVPTLEEDMADLRAVLDAAGSQQAALFGYSEAGPMCALFAATFPERVTGLVLIGSFASGGLLVETIERMGLPTLGQIAEIGEHWGEGRSLEVFAPSVVSEERMRRFGLFERAAGSPSEVRARWEMTLRVDATPVLAALRVPTLVLHRVDERLVPAVVARAMADAIPGARYVEVPGADHIPWVGDAESVLCEVEEFLTGARDPGHGERALATVVFTDIVGSTQRAAALGDAAWRALLGAHDQLVREHLDSYRGHEVKTLGDGFLATFDGPARAIHCARAIARQVATLGIDVRVGVHTGECELIDGDVGGMAVSIGARICALAGPGEVLVSRTVKDLVVGSGIDFEDRGTHQLKGVPGVWQLFAVGGQEVKHAPTHEGHAAHEGHDASPRC